MTPKEKADELVDKYMRFVDPFGAGSAPLSMSFDEDRQRGLAARCAMITADEIISEYDEDSSSSFRQDVIIYYTSVKNELDKMV